MLSPDMMRARFHELGKQRDGVVASVAPVRARYEALLAQQQQLAAQVRPVLDELKKLEQPLFEIDQERALIARALNHRTGEPV